MGLDMYLEKEKFLGKNLSLEQLIRVKKAVIAFQNSDYLKTKGVVAKWRKANAIHKWFVDNVQGGKDDCGCYQVKRTDIENLLSVVKQVLKKKSLAEKLLPTKEGFFFGGLGYDEYYFEDLEYTKEILENILKIDDFGEFVYYYHSSW